MTVEQVPFRKVPAKFAAAEVEGDLSLDYWRNTHREFFEHVAEDDHPFSNDEIVQCETFELAWPQIATNSNEPSSGTTSIKFWIADSPTTSAIE